MRPYGIPPHTWGDDWAKSKAHRCYRHHSGCKKIPYRDWTGADYYDLYCAKHYLNYPDKRMICTAKPCPKKRKYRNHHDSIRSSFKTNGAKRSTKRLWKRLGRIANQREIRNQINELHSCIL